MSIYGGKTPSDLRKYTETLTGDIRGPIGDNVTVSRNTCKNDRIGRGNVENAPALHQMSTKRTYKKYAVYRRTCNQSSMILGAEKYAVYRRGKEATGTTGGPEFFVASIVPGVITKVSSIGKPCLNQVVR